jgi:hypothetical protein
MESPADNTAGGITGGSTTDTAVAPMADTTIGDTIR